MSKKIKVLQVVNSLGIGGNPIFVMNYYRVIDKEKFQVDFLIFESKLDYYDEVIQQGSKVYIYPNNIDNKLLRFIDQMRFVRKVIKETYYDVVHCHSCSFKGIFRGVIPAHFYGKTKVIAHSHNVGMRKKNIIDRIVRKALKKFMVSCIDYGFACSDLAGESKYTEKFMKSKKYRVIHNAINVEKYQYNFDLCKKMRTLYKIPEDALVIGNVGRLATQKNQKYLLNIFYHIQKRDNNTYLVVVGDGELKEQLYLEAQKLKIVDKVIFTGVSLNVEQYYSMMDIFVLTSIFEGLGLVLIEAQTSGLPCIASDGVPQEAKITDVFQYLSLNAGYEIWADTILSTHKNDNRIDAYLEVKGTEYDLKKECKILEKYYCS